MECGRVEVGVGPVGKKPLEIAHRLREPLGQPAGDHRELRPDRPDSEGRRLVRRGEFPHRVVTEPVGILLIPELQRVEFGAESGGEAPGVGVHFAQVVRQRPVPPAHGGRRVVKDGQHFEPAFAEQPGTGEELLPVGFAVRSRLRIVPAEPVAHDRHAEQPGEVGSAGEHVFAGFGGAAPDPAQGRIDPVKAFGGPAEFRRIGDDGERRPLRTGADGVVAGRQPVEPDFGGKRSAPHRLLPPVPDFEFRRGRTGVRAVKTHFIAGGEDIADPAGGQFGGSRNSERRGRRQRGDFFPCPVQRVPPVSGAESSTSRRSSGSIRTSISDSSFPGRLLRIPVPALLL